MWIGAIDGSDVLLPYPLMPLASHIANILISISFKHINIQSSSDRAKLCELMFEKFDAPAVFLSKDAGKVIFRTLEL